MSTTLAGVTQLRSPERLGSSELLGSAECMQQLRSQMATVAARSCTVLICGESGTGKELVAREIHANSPRADSPFITADCTTLRDTLFESILFGHVKGAFTGAEQDTLGLVRAADGGTLFLDEIGELQPHVQAKLLRCIQENVVLPVGAVHPVPVNVRIVAATHRDLRQMVARGRFREDLYFRLDVVRLRVPPLRERPEDIALLAEHFLLQYARMHEEPVRALSSQARAALRHYQWPGNVRELRNSMERCAILSRGKFLMLEELPETIRQAAPPETPQGKVGTIIPLAAAERILIKRALRATGGNQSRAAALLGVERHRLGRMIRRHGLDEFARAMTA